MDEAPPFRCHSLITYRSLMFAAALIACIAMISLAAVADDSDAQFTVAGINYEPTSDSAVSVVESVCSGSIIIPASVENEGKTYAVTSIGDYAFVNCSSLISVELPEGLLSIGNSSFSCCTSLRTIDIPDSVTDIKWWAFGSCKSLTSVALGKNVTSVARDSFTGSTSLEAITVPDGNEHYRSVDGILFSKDMTELVCYPAGKAGESYTTPSGITTIGADAFHGCQHLKDVIISEGVVSIESGAFEFSSALISVSLPDSLERIGSDVFEFCESLVSVTFGTGIEKIGDYCFVYCKSLERITIPEGNPYYSSDNGVLLDHDRTELIWYPANRDGETYSIPATVKTLKSYSFEYCTKLKSVIIPDGVYTIESQNFSYCENLENVSIPDSVESLGYGVFNDCKSMRSVRLSENLANIPTDSFYGCSSLESISIPDSVSSVGMNCFRNCDSLGSLTLGKGLKEVGASSFSGCKSLREIDIQGKDTLLGEGVFTGSSSLERLNVAADNVHYCSDDGVLLDKARTVILLYPALRAGTSYTIPDTVTSIGVGTFSSCELLETVIIPDSVVTIGKQAFCGCSKLKYIDLPSGLTVIGDNAFSSSSMVQIDIPGAVTSIGEDAFLNCFKMTAINVSPDNANYSSDDGILYDKNKKVLLKYPQGKAGTSYSIPEGVESVLDKSLYSQELTSITLPASFTQKLTDSIGYAPKLKEIKVSADNPNFASKDGVLFDKDITVLIMVPHGFEQTTYHIPDTVVTIEGSLYNIESLIVPASVRNISEDALYWHVRNIYLRSCHLESCYPITKAMNLISIDAGTTGADVLFKNCTFKTMDGKEIDKSDLAGHTYEYEDGVMVRTGGSTDPDDPGFNYWLLLIPAIIIIVVADIIITKRRH